MDQWCRREKKKMREMRDDKCFIKQDTRHNTQDRPFQLLLFLVLLLLASTTVVIYLFPHSDTIRYSIRRNWIVLVTSWEQFNTIQLITTITSSSNPIQSNRRNKRAVWSTITITITITSGHWFIILTRAALFYFSNSDKNPIESNRRDNRHRNHQEKLISSYLILSHLYITVRTVS